MISLRLRTLAGALLVAGGTALAAPAAVLANGVSDDRVSLPDGPGSISGAGENLSVDLNMGQMRYAIPIPVPSGHAGATPSLSLDYGSGGGATVVGMGWDLSVPYIERSTVRGLPRYGADDLFFANGSTELVPVGDGVYRARFEGGFVRYRFASAGPDGYWVAEYPDGRVGYFGARADGTLEPHARATGEVDDAGGAGTFRYMLVELRDVHGHRVHYDYDKLGGNTPLVSRIGYVFDGETPRYTVDFNYEAREDLLSDCAPTFELVLGHRLKDVVVRSAGSQLNRFALAYEDYDSAGGVSRLLSVTRHGADDTPYPAVQRFTYSRSMGSDGATGAYLVEMGKPAIGGGMVSGKTTLVDLDADGLPDLVHTAGDGGHTFFMNRLDGELRPSFAAAGRESVVATGQTPWDLSLPSVQAFDVNGDGLTDIYDRVNGAALCNDGSGDWNGSGCLAVSGNGDASFAEDADSDDGSDDPDPANIRFLDFDNDKRIDWVRTDSAESTVVFVNTDAGFSARTVDPIGFQFDDVAPNIRPSFADMNGDGLQDPARVIVVSDSEVKVEYRLNLGFGRWDALRTVQLSGSDLQNAEVSLEDLNGDGADDLVAVLSDQVRFALNRNGDRFDDFLTIAAADGADLRVPGLPTYTPGATTVLFADMNGTGTSDIVWIDMDGSVRFLELFRVRPNLLDRIENGLGGVQTVTYGTAAEQAKLAELDGQPWTETLTQPMNVVVRRDVWTSLTGGEDGEGLHEVQTYSYRNGYYDGVNKSFRGFADVESLHVGSESQASGLELLHYELGIDDPYRKGLLLERTLMADPAGEALRIETTRTEYADCPVEGVPSAGAIRVRYVCDVASETELSEGRPEAEWVTTRSERTYDGYGNVTVDRNLGVLDQDGDEAITETTYIAPGASQEHPWMLNLAQRSESFGADAELRAITVHHYDGPAYEGLPEGELERGLLTRTVQFVSATESIDAVRNAHDTHGNVIGTIDPNGAPDEANGHRRNYTMDADGLRVVRTEIPLEDADGEAYSLVREYRYHPSYDLPSLASAWMIERGGEVISSRDQMVYSYDVFQRPVSYTLPGDSAEAPSYHFRYELGAPVSRVVVARRTQAGGDEDIEQIECFDGRGRRVQGRVALGDGEYQVDGFSVFNSRGSVVRSYQPFVSDSAQCDRTPPDDALFTAYRYDATGRLLERTEPDAEDFGEASVARVEYRPLSVLSFDLEDTDPDSPHFGTPTVRTSDGLGRLVAFSRYLESGAEPEQTTLDYDGLGHLIRYTDAGGNVKAADYDLLGRALRVVDPNAGEVHYAYDPAGNLIARTDGRGERTERDYDGMNRLIAQRAGDDASQHVGVRYDLAPEGCDASDCSHGAGQVTRRSFVLADGSAAYRDMGYSPRGLLAYDALHVMGFAFETRLRHDNLDRLAEVTFPDGQVEQRNYDRASRLVAIDGIIDDVVYDGRGLVADIAFRNGTQEHFSYDARMRTTRARTLDGEGDAILDLVFTRDRVGNLLASEDAGRHPFTQAFEYDAHYRPIAASFSFDGQAEQVDYAYDATDRVLSRSSDLGDASRAHLGKLDYDKNRPMAVTAAGGLRMRYDDAGQLIERGDLSLAWDYRGLPMRLEGDGGVTRLSYSDDGAPLVVEEAGGISIDVGSNFEVRDGIGYWYPRQGDRRYARSESTTLAARMFPDGDEDGRISAHDAYLIARTDAKDSEDAAPAETALRMLRSAARRLLVSKAPVFLHQDQVFSIVAASDGAGKTIATRSYYPNGALRNEDGFVDRYGFTGQRGLAGTQLLQFKHRLFDARTGRWISADPKFELLSEGAVTTVGEGTSAYAYVGNGGVNGHDPDGLTKTPGGGRRRSKSTGHTPGGTTRRKSNDSMYGGGSRKSSTSSSGSSSSGSMHGMDHMTPGRSPSSSISSNGSFAANVQMRSHAGSNASMSSRQIMAHGQTPGGAYEPRRSSSIDVDDIEISMSGSRNSVSSAGAVGSVTSVAPSAPSANSSSSSESRIGPSGGNKYALSFQHEVNQVAVRPPPAPSMPVANPNPLSDMHKRQTLGVVTVSLAFTAVIGGVIGGVVAEATGAIDLVPML